MGDHWTSFKNLDSDNEQHQSIRKLLNDIDLKELCQRSLEIRRSLIPHLDTSVTCSINLDKFTSGRYHVVLQVLFSDRIRWIARIRIHDSTSDDLDVESAMMSEIATIELIRAKTKIPAPEVFGFDVSSTVKNLVRARYLLMAELPGRALDGTFASSVPEKFRRKVALQFADYYYQLSKLRFEAIGLLVPCMAQGDAVAPSAIALCELNGRPATTGLMVRDGITTSLEYLYLHRRKCNEQALAQSPGDQDIAVSAWFLEQAISSMIAPEYLHGPFPICHTDMHYNNILADKDYNITGMVDWSDLSTGPIELFAANPEFMTYPGLSEESNRPIKEFTDVVAREMERLASECGDEMGIALAGLIGSARAELIYRCIYTWPWRTLVDAQQALRLLYGKQAKWEHFKTLYQSSQISSERERT